MRRGVTLIELVLVMTVAGILAGIAYPRVGQLLDGIAVERAARAIAMAHRHARAVAIVRGRRTQLSIAADTIRLRPVGDTSDSWAHPGPVASGVLLAGPPRVVTFSPVGLATGVSNATYVLTRGASRRTVVVSRLGRVRVTP